MIASTPLGARIQSSVIDRVVRLLREEVQEHPSEKWEEVCSRVQDKTGVHVSLAMYLDENAVAEGLSIPKNEVPSAHPNGNTHFDTALNKNYVVVQEPGKWKLVFKFHDWVCAPEHIAKGSKAADRPGASPPTIYNEAFLVREFDRREREHGPIFAGFIVNDLLPRMGFDTTEAKRILRAMEAQDMVRTERKPNPKQPERTTTFVTLNRDHPHVARVLQGAVAIQRTFPIGSVEGESLSETIMRERR